MARPTLTLTVDKASQRDIARALDGVKSGVANRVVKQAVAKVAREAAKTAKRLAPRGPSGMLKRAIGTSFKGQPRKGKWTYKVGARRGYAATVAGKKVDATRIVHLAEFGRKAVAPTRKKAMLLGSLGVVRKRARAARGQPFITPAWRSVETAGVGRIAADVKAGVAREAARYAARGKSIYTR